LKAQDVVKRLLGSRLLKWTVVVLAVGIGGYEISTRWHGVSQSLHQIGWLAAFEALLALLVAQYANLKVWQVLLGGLGSPLRTRVAGRILLIGQLGKYIPGSVWPVLTQMELGALNFSARIQICRPWKIQAMSCQASASASTRPVIGVSSAGRLAIFKSLLSSGLSTFGWKQAAISGTRTNTHR
jgi:hypothetical protein